VSASTVDRRHPGAADRRERLLRRLGLVPSAREVVHGYLDRSLPSGGAVVLDAGCGRTSALVPFRTRIAELVGVDIHRSEHPLPWLDRFVLADLCSDADAFPPATFDVILSSFTAEHFDDPPAAFRTMAHWLRPGGWLVLSTVNRANPIVNGYLSLPSSVGRPLQRAVKAEGGDAHRLVGACNTPGRLRRGLVQASLADIEMTTTDHLARAWGRHAATFAIGLAGDLASHPFTARRSTIVVRARRVD